MSDANVEKLFDDQTGFKGILKVEEPIDPLSSQILTLQRWRRLLAVRWLCFIALAGALAVWGYSVIDPTPWRFGVSTAYSILVLAPTFVLYHLRSD